MVGGIVRPICFAVLRLITSSNFVGCSTGRSAGFVSFKIDNNYAEDPKRAASVMQWFAIGCGTQR